MKKFTMLATAAVISAAAAAPAFAYTVTNSLTGNFAITGLNDTPIISGGSIVGFSGNDTFKVTASNLVGDINVVVPPSGSYTVYTGGSATVDWGGTGSPLSVSVAPAVQLFTGLLGFTGATAASYSTTFPSGTTGSSGNFLLNYDGATSASVLSSLNALLGGSPFSIPTGTGTLDISYSLFSDGFEINFTESNLNWLGFGAILGAADLSGDARTIGSIDGTFALRDVTANVVPEPATLALLGLGLAGLGAVRRRKQA